MARFREFVATAALAGVIAAGSVPAVGAAGNLLRLRAEAPVSLHQLGSISSFTPSIGDSALSQAYERAVLNRGNNSFRFTPTSGSLSGRREITVLVRADSRMARADDRGTPSLGIAPLAFNLDASRGWRKFALPESVGRKPLDPVIQDLKAVGSFSLERSNPRLTANVQLDAKRDVGTAPRTLAGENQLSVDVGSSYSLTRNLNVTAGLRYARPDNRLTPITDQRQDNQAVYVGTVFRF